MKLLDDFHAWRVRRRAIKHRKRMRKMAVVFRETPIEPKCIARNWREPNR